MAPADLDLRSGQLVQPDLFVVPLGTNGAAPRGWADCGVPIMIAEITSPSTARDDRITKRHRFQRSAIAEYWVVDADARVMERWTPGDTRPEVLTEQITWRLAGVDEPLVIDLVTYFREVWGEG